ncbi:MAG: DNA-binding protein [Bacteroidetes bacterium]|nr:DNA-binding protein [Bacteroidota bacterium]
MKTEKDQKKSEPAEKKQDYVRASYALKKKIVDLVSNGRISKNAAAKKYNVSRSSLDYWMNKFSTLEEKETTMSKDKELKKLRQRIEELEFIKDFQQDLIVEYEIETGDLKSKKYLPEQLAKEIEQKRKRHSKTAL